MGQTKGIFMLEQNIICQDMDNVDYDIFNGFDYVALGHIHKPQPMGRQSVRYSGAPVKYALDESNDVLSDANKLLKKWANSGFKDPSQVQEQLKKSLPKEVKKSYDTEKVGRSSVLDWAKRYASKEENE